MLRTHFVFAAALFPLLSIAQETTGALPFSFTQDLPAHDGLVAEVTAFDKEEAAADDAWRAAAGKLPLYARFVRAAADLSDRGAWSEMPGGERIWRTRVTSPGAQAIELFFTDAHIPNGAQVHVYDPSGSNVLGGYTQAHVQPDGSLATEMIPGESCVVEYHEPASVRGEGSLRLTRLLHAYALEEALLTGACEVDVNCSEGTEWADQRDAVVRIRVITSSGAGYCTGTLMNNTANDCKGYILTAFHCTEESVAGDFPSYQFRFNYQRSACGMGSATGNGLTGCAFRAGSQDQGGTYGSDYALLELTSAIPASYTPYWAGWDVNSNAAPSGVCIHHPDGDVKKVSTFTSAASSSTWSGNTSGSHWRVIWTATSNGHGVTEPGSSGSPLFNPSKRVVGTLTGGSSCCTVNGCGLPGSGPTAPDFFGKMGYHWWENNPNPAAEELHWWLAPITGPAFQNGSRNPCGPIGIDELGSIRPSLFPNPTRGSFTVRLPEGHEGADEVQVLDATGRLVLRAPLLGHSASFDAATWAAGAYLIRILDDGRTVGSAVLMR